MRERGRERESMTYIHVGRCGYDTCTHLYIRVRGIGKIHVRKPVCSSILVCSSNSLERLYLCLMSSVRSRRKLTESSSSQFLMVKLA